ncbi:MAG TPA: hypothetical protein VFH95_12695 [Candidatus Kapabacteria bacterium]|nr:hypothetical protein [Candidatus Kapabacteria bacterium]
MSTTATIRLYEMLKPKLGEQESRVFIQHFEESFEEQFESKTHDLATKGDLKVAVAELRGEIDVKIAQSKVDLIKWMVGLWIAQIAAIIGLYFAR